MKCRKGGNSRCKYLAPAVAVLVLLAVLLIWTLLRADHLPAERANDEHSLRSEPPTTETKTLPHTSEPYLGTEQSWTTTATNATTSPVESEEDENWPDLRPIVYPTARSTAEPSSTTAHSQSEEMPTETADYADVGHFPEPTLKEVVLDAANHHLTETVEPTTASVVVGGSTTFKNEHVGAEKSGSESQDDYDLFWMRRPKIRPTVETATPPHHPHHHQRIYHVTGHHHQLSATTTSTPTTSATPASSTVATAEEDRFREEIIDLIEDLDNGDEPKRHQTPPDGHRHLGEDNEIRPVVFEINPEDSWFQPPANSAGKPVHETHEDRKDNELPGVDASVERPSAHLHKAHLSPPDPVWRRERPVPVKTPEPVWRRRPPEDRDSITLPPPPIPTAELQGEDSGRPKVVPFGVSATVTTTFRNRGKSQDNEINRSFPSTFDDPNQRRRDRRNTPVIVTALLDIGRGDWIRFTRHFDIYLTWFLDLLQMENRIIIYCDDAVVNFLANRVDIDWDRLQVIPISLRDLPFYRHREEIQRIIDREQENWQDEWDLRIRDHPEAKFADYDILVNSKPYLLKNASQISRFASEFFVWVDAGYSHGSQDVIPRDLWNPQLTPGKITLVKLTGTLDKAHRYTLDLVYRKERSVISGGFLAGDVATIQRFYVFFYITFMGLLDSGKVDDDQTTLLMTIRDYTSTFNVLSGGWFDAFRIIPSQLPANPQF